MRFGLVWRRLLLLCFWVDVEFGGLDIRDRGGIGENQVLGKFPRYSKLLGWLSLSQRWTCVFPFNFCLVVADGSSALIGPLPPTQLEAS